MDDKTWGMIERDFNKAQGEVEKILGGGPNFFVKVVRQYLNPTIVTEICDLDDECGEFMYYRAIRDTLKEIILTGKGKFTWYFNGAPQEIKNYLEE